MKDRIEPLYPEEQMQIEQQALNIFLGVADYGNDGIEHLINSIKALQQRLNDFEDGNKI